MGLIEYQKKRKLQESREPEATIDSSGGQRFVV